MFLIGWGACRDLDEDQEHFNLYLIITFTKTIPYKLQIITATRTQQATSQVM